MLCYTDGAMGSAKGDKGKGKGKGTTALPNERVVHFKEDPKDDQGKGGKAKGKGKQQRRPGQGAAEVVQAGSHGDRWADAVALAYQGDVLSVASALVELRLGGQRAAGVCG